MIYDYVDGSVPVLWRMHQRRLKGYAAIGYSVTTAGAAVDYSSNGSLFSGDERASE